MAVILFPKNVIKTFCAVTFELPSVSCVKSSKCLTLNFDMFQQKKFGGFLLGSLIVHPYLNGIENNSFAISLILSL